MWGSAIAGGTMLAGGLVSAGSALFGGKKNSQTAEQKMAGQLAMNQMGFMNDAINQYRNLYQQYYWPIEQTLAGNYQEDITASRPYEVNMRDYQLERGDQLIDLANETNPMLDEGRKSLIRRLSEGEDVLAGRYREQASADVASSFANQRQQSTRNMQMMGVNPNSAAWANQANSMNQSEALAQAAGRTSASRQAETDSLQRQMQAQQYAVNPQMLFDPGTITPGMSIGQLTGGSTQNAALGSQGQQKQDPWATAGAAIGGIGTGLAGMASAFGW